MWKIVKSVAVVHIVINTWIFQALDIGIFFKISTLFFGLEKTNSMYSPQ